MRLIPPQSGRESATLVDEGFQRSPPRNPANDKALRHEQNAPGVWDTPFLAECVAPHFVADDNTPVFESVRFLQLSESGAFVHCQVVGLVTFDQVLWFFFRGVDRIAFELDFGGDFFLNRSSDPACF
jgi:hypothetical protein